MKRIVTIVLLLCLLAVSAGCADLYVRGPFVGRIDAAAIKAAEDRPQAADNKFTDEQCTSILSENRLLFTDCSATTTTNFFAYVFGDKQLFATPTYATLIDKTALLSVETEAAATTRPVEWLNKAVVGEATVLIKLKQAKDGQKE